MNNITAMTLTILTLLFAVASFTTQSHEQENTHSPAPYLIASSDLRSGQDNKPFSRILIDSAEEPVYLSLITDFEPPCSGWFEGPDYSKDGITCEWLIVLDTCNPFEIFEGEISLSDENVCAPLLLIKSPVGDAYNRVRTCRGYGYHLTGFYSIQYLEATHGREFYEAIPVQVDAERARVTHQKIADQTCYSMPEE